LKLCPEEKKQRAEQRKQEKYDKEHKIINGVIFKWCKSCKDWIQMDDEHFYKNKKNSTDGYYPECKQCSIKRTIKWQEDNPEQYAKLIYERGKNPSKQRLKTLNRQGLKQRLKGYNLEWSRNNPNKLKEYRLKRELNKTHEISKEELKELYEYADSKCMFCDMTEEYAKYLYGEKLHKDHAYNDGSNGINNCILACKGCNCSKHKKDWDEWFTPDNPIYDEVNYNRIKAWLDKFKDNKNESP
jgi:hypothetical protein